MRDAWARCAAAVASGLAVAAGILVVVALAGMRHPWTSGYVSEAGVTTYPREWVYRSGIFAVSVALVLVGVVWAGAPPPSGYHPAGFSITRPVGSRLLASQILASGLLVAGLLVAGLLVVAGGLGAVSASVSCTAGCPLPPYEHTTAMDLLHASASSLAIGLAAVAMLVIAATSADGPMRWCARVGFILTGPALVALGVCLLALGRATPTAILERVVLAEVLAWLIVTAIRLTISPNATSLRDLEMLT